MDDVRQQLDRLRRGWRRIRARNLAGRVHLALLLAALALALGHRLFGPWPGLDRLAGSLLLTLVVALLLFLLGTLLRFGLARVLRLSRVALARRLDDRMAYGDAVDTALALPAPREDRPVEVFLETQTVGRLRELDPGRLWRRRGELPWIRGVLVLLFVFVLHAPGAGAIPGPWGAGRGDEGALGAQPEERADEALDADRWLRDHVRLLLRRPEVERRPLLLAARLLSDRALPEPLAGDLVLLWDGEEVAVGTLGGEAGERVDRTAPIDLAALEALTDALTPGRHVAQAFLRPTTGPWRSAIESNRLIVVLEEDSGGGGGADQPEPQPQAPPEPPPEPEAAPPEPPPEPPPPAPDGDQEGPPPAPPDEERMEVVDPFVNEGAELVEKEDAIVAVPDETGGVEPPPLVPLADALAGGERIVERTVSDERLRPLDRAFLRRYFEALEAAVRRRGADGR